MIRREAAACGSHQSRINNMLSSAGDAAFNFHGQAPQDVSCIGQLFVALTSHNYLILYLGNKIVSLQGSVPCGAAKADVGCRRRDIGIERRSAFDGSEFPTNREVVKIKAMDACT
jgi:hypothetical protein